MGTLKIADFGFSKELPSNETHLELKHTKLGTIYTMAPEVLKGSAYGLQVFCLYNIRLTSGQLESFSIP